MSHEFLTTAAGASLATIGVLLFLARVSGPHRRLPLLRTAVAWSLMPAAKALPVLLAVFAVSAAVLSAAGAAPGAWAALSSATTPAELETAALAANADVGSAEGADAQALTALRTYVNGLKHRPAAAVTQSVRAGVPSDLPDVDTMIERLAKRLETEPGDLDGWRTLGWSYFHTGKLTDAVKAYETALALDPSNDELKGTLEEARRKTSAEASPSGVSPGTGMAK